jgi:hypothetical protein
MAEIDYVKLQEYAKKLAEERNISINKALKYSLKYHRWKNKRRK